MNTTKICFISGVLSLLAFSTACGTGIAGGGDGGTGGTGGGGSGGPNVLGTKQSGDCDSAPAFAEACDAQGGIVADGCGNSDCTIRGLSATCYPPDPPGDGEFSCDGVIPCPEGQMCLIHMPTGGDGCWRHDCKPLPDECGAMPTCDCIETATSGFACQMDGAGNPTVTVDQFQP